MVPVVLQTGGTAIYRVHLHQKREGGGKKGSSQRETLSKLGKGAVTGGKEDAKKQLKSLHQNTPKARDEQSPIRHEKKKEGRELFMGKNTSPLKVAKTKNRNPLTK